VKVTVRLPGPTGGRTARLLVSIATRPVSVSQGKATIEVGSIRDHEVVVIA
jgi:hypothetical protein